MKMMKRTLLYIVAALTGAASFTACDNDFEVPPVSGKPFETVETNTTLADVKTEYWSALSTATTIGYDANGDTLIFKGRVCSSDKSGNIYKNVVIQSVDENGQQVAFTFAVNAYDIYEKFAYGQEVAVKATGLEIGNYRSLLQLGSISGSSMTFMDESTFFEHVVATAPFADKKSVVITPTTIAELNTVKADAQQLMMWQSRIVKIENVSFVEAGKPCALGENVSRYITDESGNRLAVRMSSHADFKENLLPYGIGSVTGIITTFDNSWQLTMIDFDGLEGFDGEGEEPNPGETVEPAGEGTVESPYNVAKALEIIASGNIPEGKVYVEGVVSSIKEIDTGNFGNATYYIKDAKGNDEFYIYRGYALGGEKFTADTKLEAGANVVIYGELMNFKGNSPQMGQGNYIYSYNGQTAGGNPGGEPGEPAGDGTVDNPYNVAKTLQLITSGNITEDKVYVKGIISSIKVTEADIIYDPARGEMTKQRDNYYPVVRAKDLFQIPDGRDNVEEGILIWVEAGEKSYCLFVDELLGEQQIVVKPMPAYVNSFNIKNYGITGCSILGDGSISIILDIANLYNAAQDAF